MTYNPHSVVELCEMALDILKHGSAFNGSLLGGRTYLDLVTQAKMLAIFTMNASDGREMELPMLNAQAVQSVLCASQVRSDVQPNT